MENSSRQSVPKVSRTAFQDLLGRVGSNLFGAQVPGFCCAQGRLLVRSKSHAPVKLPRRSHRGMRRASSVVRPPSPATARWLCAVASPVLPLPRRPRRGPKPDRRRRAGMAGRPAVAKVDGPKGRGVACVKIAEAGRQALISSRGKST